MADEDEVAGPGMKVSDPAWMSIMAPTGTKTLNVVAWDDDRLDTYLCLVNTHNVGVD